MVAMGHNAIPVADERAFENAPRRRIGNAVVPLPAYQMEALQNRTRIKVYKWCRQTGKDFTASLEAVLDALTTHKPWFIVSLTERQSLATFEKVKMHCKAMGVALADLQILDGVESYYSRIEQRWCEVKTKTVILPGGGSVTALPGADPDAIAGLTGNVIFTEFALFTNGGRDHWRVVFPLITRGFRLVVISTPRGTDIKFAELCRNAKGKYFVSVVDVHRAIRDGMTLRDEEGKPISAADLEELYADPAGWKREYLVIESDEMDALIAWRFIELARLDYSILRVDTEGVDHYNPNTQNVFAALPRGPQYFLGWDVARTGHLSPIWVNALEGDVFTLRALVVMHRCDFTYMRQVLWQAMELGMIGAGDAGGLGAESCELTARRFPGRFSEFKFSSVSKPALGSTLMQTYEDVRQRIPRAGADDIAHDLHAIQKEQKHGKLVLHETKNPVDPRSHCDIAYSNGLALFAGTAPGEIRISVIDRVPAWNGAPGEDPNRDAIDPVEQQRRANLEAKA